LTRTKLRVRRLRRHQAAQVVPGHGSVDTPAGRRREVGVRRAAHVERLAERDGALHVPRRLTAALQLLQQREHEKERRHYANISVQRRARK
jgi:hypothetical protein